jgi:hypothetical protein
LCTFIYIRSYSLFSKRQNNSNLCLGLFLLQQDDDYDDDDDNEDTRIRKHPFNISLEMRQQPGELQQQQQKHKKDVYFLIKKKKIRIRTTTAKNSLYYFQNIAKSNIFKINKRTSSSSF